MKRFFPLISLIINGFFAVVMSVVSIDFLLGGGCTRTLNHKYEPAFFSQFWEIASYIYIWAPEDTIVRRLFMLIAMAITIVIPVVLAVYFWKRFQESLDKYRGLGLSIFLK